MSGVGAAVRATAAMLRQAGVVSAQAEARTLVAAACDTDPTRLALVEDLSDNQQRALAQMTTARIAGAPLQHVTGRAHFRTVTLGVGPGVFIPRPETELLAGWAIDQVQAGRSRVVELCAGSGAISAAILAESDPTALWAVERDEVGFRYLTDNLASTLAQPVLSDMRTALTEVDGTIDIVVANPPYVPTGARGQLPADVGHDPAAALFSGVDGLDDTVTVADVAARLLRAGGVVGTEHGEDQADGVAQILTKAGFIDVACHRDLTDRPRFTTARKRP